MQGVASFLATAVAYGLAAGLVAGGLLVALPVKARPLRPAWMATGTLVWLVIFWVSFRLV